MNSRSSQPLVWITVALLTAALYTSAIKWVKFSLPFAAIPTEETTLIDLTFIEFTEPTPEAEPITEPEPEPEPEPAPAPPPPPPTPEPEPMPEAPPQPRAEPTPPPEPKIDPAILKKKREAEEARARELKRQREVAKKRVEEKRRQQMAAQKAAAKKKKAADAAAAKKRAAARAKANAAAAAKRIVSKPSAISRPSPKYPSSARHAGHQGTTTLTFTVSSSGKVTSVRVSKSSGHSSLDNAALSAIRRWRFKPARNGLGQAVSYSYTLPIPFQLR